MEAMDSPDLQHTARDRRKLGHASRPGSDFPVRHVNMNVVTEFMVVPQPVSSQAYSALYPPFEQPLDQICGHGGPNTQVRAFNQEPADHALRPRRNKRPMSGRAQMGHLWPGFKQVRSLSRGSLQLSYPFA